MHGWLASQPAEANSQTMLGSPKEANTLETITCKKRKEKKRLRSTAIKLFIVT